MVLICLRLHIADYVAGCFQLEAFPVCPGHQVKAVERILFVVAEKISGLEHPVWACRRKPDKDLIGQQLLGAYAFFKKFRLLDGTYETGKRVVCVFKSRFFRNAVNDFGYATFPQKGRADIFVYKI